MAIPAMNTPLPVAPSAVNGMSAAPLGLRNVPKTSLTPDRSSLAPTESVATRPPLIS
jgi:hypothetical protein